MSEPAISLARYAQRIGYRDCAFWGVRRDSDGDYECYRVWTQSQRDMLWWALQEAQEELEQEIGYFLAPSWVTAERHKYRDPLMLRWGHVIAGGVLSDTMLEAGAAVDYSADPAIVTVAAGTCAAGNIRVYHAGTDDEITPDSILVAAGVATIAIPWCRLVAPAYWDNPGTGWDYADVATWGAATVDVRCRTNSAATQAMLIWRHDCNEACALRGCTDYRKTACIYVRRPEISVVDVTRADYADGVWVAGTLCSDVCYGSPNWVEVNYYSGLQALTRQAEDAIIRLAHAKMPEEPCGCEVTQRLWRRDRNVPQVLTRERINCPFGMSDGAWWAWRQAQRMRLVRGGRPA